MSDTDQTTDLAASFRLPGVAHAYRCRPPYPAEVFDTLERLIVTEPRHVLDLGAGDGALARPLAERVDRVDAVEISQPMVDAGRRRPGGNHENLVWLVNAAENTHLPGPYALITAGASLHWMTWEPTLDHINRMLAPGAVLAIVDQSYHMLACRDALQHVIAKHSRDPTYDPTFSLPDALRRKGLFDIHGHRETPPMRIHQTVHDYVEQFHSTASLARELMSPAEAAQFDQEIRAAVHDHEDDRGTLTMHTVATITWGRPVRTGAPSGPGQNPQLGASWRLG